MLDFVPNSAKAEPVDIFLRPTVDGINLFGKNFVCQSRMSSPPGYTFVEPSAPDVAHPLSNEDIWNWYEAGKLRFVTRPDAKIPVSAKRSLERALATMSQREKANIERRLRYCEAIDEAGIGLKRSAELWQPLCDAVSAKCGEETQHWKTHYRWWLAWAKAGKDPRVLAGDERSRGRRERRLTDLQSKCMEEALKEWLDRKRPTFARAQHAVNAAITKAVGGPDEVLRLIDENKSPLIGYKSVRADLVKLGRAKRLHYRHGSKAARDEITSTYPGPQSDLPLERVDADFKYLGLFVIDEETMLPLGTPYVAGGMDHFSGAVAGSDIGFDPPGSASASRLLANIIQRKTFDDLVMDDYGRPPIRHDWPVNGVPQFFNLDNDRAFHSTHFVAAAKAIGCDVKFLKPACPHMKGMIESFWKAVQQSYCDMFPGKRLRVFDEPGPDYKPEEYAVVTLKALRTILAKAIVDVHNRTKDERSGQIRIERYRKAALIDPPQPVPPHSDIVELVGCYKERKATRKGVLIFGMFYNSSELARYRNDFRKDPKVEVRYSPDDIGTVFVVDRDRGVVIKVPCVLREYARGLTLHQHRVIRRHAIDRGAQGRIYRQQLEAAKAELHLLGKELFSKKKNRRLRQRMAQYFGMSPQALEKVNAKINDPNASDLLDYDETSEFGDDDQFAVVEPEVDETDPNSDVFENARKISKSDEEQPRRKPQIRKFVEPKPPGPEQSRGARENVEPVPEPAEISVETERSETVGAKEGADPRNGNEPKRMSKLRLPTASGVRMIKMKRREK